MLFGGRTRKDSPEVEANGAVDEAQSFLGLARAELEEGSETEKLVVRVQRDLWVLMAELATAPQARDRLRPGETLVTQAMIDEIEARIDELQAGYEMPREFVVPGQGRQSALFDVARTVVRRAERLAVGVAAEGSLVIPYLNRLSDLCWILARSQEERHLLSAERKSGEGSAGKRRRRTGP